MGIIGIDKLKSDNFGGSKNYLLLLDVRGVAVFPEIINRNIIDEIEVVEGYDWVRWDVTNETLAFIDTPVEEGGVKGYNQELRLIFPKDRLELQQRVMSSAKTRCIVLHPSANGAWKVIGTKENPAEIKRPVIIHGSNPRELNKYDAIITNTTTHEAPHYQGVLPDPEATPNIIEDPTPTVDAESEVVLQSKIVHAFAPEAEWLAWNGVLKSTQFAFSTDKLLPGSNMMDWKVGNDVDTWADLSYFGSSISGIVSLEQVLSVNNSTGELAIQSPNTFSILNIINDYGSITYTTPTRQNGVYIYDVASILEYVNNDITKFGNVQINDESNKILHSDLLEFDAPDIKLNQETANKILATNAGKLIKALYTLDADSTFAADSDTHIATQKATKAQIALQIAALIDSSPTTLDTLNELAAALGDDPNFATTITTLISTKLSLSGGTMTGPIIEKSAALASLDIDWSVGNLFYKTLTADSVITFSNDTNGQTVKVVLIQDATPRTVTWPAGVKWIGDVTPEQTSISGAHSVYTLTKQNGVISGEAGAVGGDEVEFAFIAANRFLTMN